MCTLLYLPQLESGYKLYSALWWHSSTLASGLLQGFIVGQPIIVVVINTQFDHVSGYAILYLLRALAL